MKNRLLVLRVLHLELDKILGRLPLLELGNQNVYQWSDNFPNINRIDFDESPGLKIQPDGTKSISD